MVRYLGPRLRILKRLGVTYLLGFSNKYNYNNIQRNNSNFGKLSEFSLKLFEKKKFKYYYGIKEKQLKIYINISNYKQSIKGLGLLCIIEKRLDVTLFRVGFSNSISQSRQFITHGNIFVNKYCVKNPKFIINIGDIIYIKPNSFLKYIIKKNLIKNFKINNFIFFEINLTKKNILPQNLICIFSLKTLILREIYPRDILLNINYFLILYR